MIFCEKREWNNHIAFSENVKRKKGAFRSGRLIRGGGKERRVFERNRTHSGASAFVPVFAGGALEMLFETCGKAGHAFIPGMFRDEKDRTVGFREEPSGAPQTDVENQIGWRRIIRIPL